MNRRPKYRCPCWKIFKFTYQRKCSVLCSLDIFQKEEGGLNNNFFKFVLFFCFFFIPQNQNAKCIEVERQTNERKKKIENRNENQTTNAFSHVCHCSCNEKKKLTNIPKKIIILHCILLSFSGHFSFRGNLKTKERRNKKKF